MELAPGEECSDGRKQVSQWAGRLLRIWIWVQLIVDVDHGCQREDIEDVGVVVFSFGPPLVSYVQKLLGEECTVRQQVSCSGEVTQEVSPLAPVVVLQCWENRLRRKAAPICHQLKCKHVVDGQPGHTVVFKDVFKLKVTW